jgi:glycerophosphoryl diester phosphodiesterase
MHTTWTSDESTGCDRRLVALPDPFLPSGAEDGRIRVLGHRGSRGPGRPENSVAAVSEALLLGADGVEIDVRLTADDVLVLAHDTYAPTRSGFRQDVVSSISNDLLDAAGRDPIATLDEVLAAVPAGAQLVVEVKPVTDAAVAVRTARVLADVLAAGGGCAEITISSFDADLLALIRTTCADLPVRTALLGEKTDSAAVIVRRAHEDGHDEVHLPLVAVRRAPQVVETAHALGLSVALWTVTRRDDLRCVTELGVDAVITDDVLAAWSELDRAADVRETIAA